MPQIIDYQDVATTMTELGLVCLYYNSGAFGFAEATATHTVGWIGPDDSTIRPEAREYIRYIRPPVAGTLAELALREWLEHLNGPIWLTPKSHWAYELDFGNHTWLPAALKAAALTDAQVNTLAGRHDGSAVQFPVEEQDQFHSLLLAMNEHLFGSDFLLSWPNCQVVCTIHHHRQLWWTTPNASIIAGVELLTRQQ